MAYENNGVWNIVYHLFPKESNITVMQKYDGNTGNLRKITITIKKGPPGRQPPACRWFLEAPALFGPFSSYLFTFPFCIKRHVFCHFAFEIPGFFTLLILVPAYKLIAAAFGLWLRKLVIIMHFFG